MLVKTDGDGLYSRLFLKRGDKCTSVSHYIRQGDKKTDSHVHSTNEGRAEEEKRCR